MLTSAFTEPSPPLSAFVCIQLDPPSPSVQMSQPLWMTPSHNWGLQWVGNGWTYLLCIVEFHAYARLQQQANIPTVLCHTPAVLVWQGRQSCRRWNGNGGRCWRQRRWLCATGRRCFNTNDYAGCIVQRIGMLERQLGTTIFLQTCYNCKYQNTNNQWLQHNTISQEWGLFNNS